MNKKSMTALVSAFARAYHADVNEVKIFNDCIAKRLLSCEEFAEISEQMAKGVSFFFPDFCGTKNEALRLVTDKNLSPTTLSRSAFAESALKTAVKIGALQYLIFAAGYDSFAYRQPTWAKGLEIFEVDHPLTAADKKTRLLRAGLTVPQNAHYISMDFSKQTAVTASCCADTTFKDAFSGSCFNSAKISFCSLLGISYYLSADDFFSLIKNIAAIVPSGSSIAFDYPIKQNKDEDTSQKTDEEFEKDYTCTEDFTQFADENLEKASMCAEPLNHSSGEELNKQAKLARAAGEEMKGGFSYTELEKALSDIGFLIYEHLSPEEITNQYFSGYNSANPSHKMQATDGVCFCLAVKKS